MKVLLTGSSGWLGQTLAPRLRALGHEVFGLDPEPSANTSIVGSITDRTTVRSAIRDCRVHAIIHAGALHKPDIERRSRADFVAVNISGTMNLLEEAVAHGVERFVFTSTTSLMISRSIRAGKAGGASRAAWLTEETLPEPRNIYGVTKLAGEHLCRLYHQQFGLPVVVLRTGRFFPEEDDMAHTITQSDANTKANELLFRRLTVADAAEAHVSALDKATELGFDIFIISAPPPFSVDDCEALMSDAPSVVARYFPEYPSLYARRGWTMFEAIDRVYDSSRAAERLGFVCRTGFRELLVELKAADQGFR
jgi:UDP-glucose 4-epimerase